MTKTVASNAARLSRRALLGSGIALLSRPAAAVPDPVAIVGRIELARGRVWLDVTIGGRGPFRFILDTGADVSAIDPALATTLALSRVGHRRMSGIGGVVDLDFYQARDVVFGGGVRQASALFGALITGQGAGEGAGLLAAGVFTTRDSDLDFARGEWRLYPAGRPDRDGWTRLASSISSPSATSSTKIRVTTALDGSRFDLLADTGAHSDMLLFPGTVRRSGLWDDTRPFAPEALRGIGGTAERIGRVVRARRLEVGPFVFDAPLVRLYDPKDFLPAQFDGLLGLSVLERLNLSTDVRAAKLWAQTNDRPKPPERYSYSGLWLDRLPDSRAKIVALSPASPAADAGLARGDVLGGVEWPQLLRRLGGPPGSVVPITVETPAGPSPRTLTLRAFL